MTTTKFCRVCGETKPYSEFYTHRRVCRKCHCKRGSLWQKNNQNKVRAYATASYHRTNYYGRNKERIRLDRQRYYQKNRSKMDAEAAAHKAVARLATPEWSIKFFVEEAYRLARLRTKLTGIKWHVDHIVPLRNRLVCGLHAHTNVRVIPASVNCGKRNLHWPDMPC